MSAKSAYAAAEAAIAKAIAEGADSLELSGEEFRDLETLPPEIAELKNLVSLNLSNTRISDLTPLQGMTAMTTLALANTQIGDLTPLQGMTAMTTLRLNNTQISDLTPLKDMTAMTSLWLNNTQISDLTPLQGMTAMKMLGLGDTRISDLTPLKDMTAMTTLRLNSTTVVDLRPVRAMQSLLDNEIPIDGINFTNIPALALDPELARIAEIKDNRARGAALLAYLDKIGDDWPPVPAGAPAPPAQVSAPLLAEFQHNRIVEAKHPPDLPTDVEQRARAGWDVLKEMHGDADDLLMKHNLPHLVRALGGFGRALGERFEDVNAIGLGMQGQRIIEIAKSARAELMDEPAADLRAFAANIATYLQRFPDWQAYLQQDTELIGPDGVAENLQALRQLDQAFQGSAIIADDLAGKFDDLVDTAADEDVDKPLAARGVLGSLSNILSALAGVALKIPGDVARDTYKLGVKTAAAGLLVTLGATLTLLAAKFPLYLGWITAILRYLGFA